MKKLFALMLSLMLALSLVACSNIDTTQANETNDDTSEVVELPTGIYVTLGTEYLSLDDLVLPLEDYGYVSIAIDEEKSDYDLSVAGEYTLVVILTDSDGNTTEVSLPLVVEAEEEVVAEEKIAEGVTVKLTSKDSTLETISSLSEETKLVINTNNLIATELTDKLSSKTMTLAAAKYPVYSSLQIISKLTTKNTTLDNVLSLVLEIEEETGSSSSSSYNANTGLNTDPTYYGLDPNNVYVKAAMSLLGETGTCMDILNRLGNIVFGDDIFVYNKSEEMRDVWVPSMTVDYINNVSWSTISSQLQVGDVIYYNQMPSGYGLVSHVAVYLGNGYALHGNWTNGIARIGRAYQEAGSYNLWSGTHTLTNSSGTTYREYYATLEESMCEIYKSARPYYYGTLRIWCESNGFI